MSAPPRPPRLPLALLERILPSGRRSDAILGDLHEEFEARAGRHPLRARLRCWTDASGIAARYLLERARRRRLDPHRTTRREHLVDTLLLNVRYALRRILGAPAFTLIAIVSLGLGIGANTAIFSLVNAVVLRDLPFEEPESLVDVYLEGEGFTHGTLSYPDYEDAVEATGEVFEGLAGTQLTLVQTDTDAGVEVAFAEAVTGSYFPLLGVDPAVGRLFTAEDDVSAGAHPVVVLGHGFWQRRFGGAADVMGTEMRLSGRAYTVIGVAPEAYTGNLRGLVPDLYVPILMYDELNGGGNTLENRGNQSLFVKARLRPGVSRARAEAALEGLATSLRTQHPLQWPAAKGFVLVPTEDVIMNPMIDRVILPAAATIMVVVGLVLLIACANLASFLLARAADRRKEIAVRLAMGARRGALVFQLLTETLILSGLGGFLGVGLAVVSLDALQRADLPLPLPIDLDLSLDAAVLGFTVAISIGAGILFGLVPALQGTNPDVAPVLRDETAGGGRARGAWLRDLLVVGQVAVSVVLLVASGLFLRSLAASRGIDPGFGHEPTGIVQLVTPATRYDEEEARVYRTSVKERIARLPGVEAVGATGNLHLNLLSTSTARVEVDGVEPPAGEDFHRIDTTPVDDGFFDAAGIPIVAGRTFGPTDVPDGEPVVIVNRTFAERFFPGEAAVGRTIRLGGEDASIVGVSRDTKVRQLGEAPRPFLYTSLRQRHTPYVTLLARTRGDASRTALEMIRAARALDPEILIAQSTTMERHLAIMLVGREMGALLVSAFAALALVLASIGLYGVVSYAVSRRAREVGIRLSLGAETGAVVRMLTGGGMKLVAAGGVVGLLLAALLARLLGSLLYGVPALDPVTFVGVPLVLGTVAALAAWIPARRASRVDPVAALRSE